MARPTGRGVALLAATIVLFAAGVLAGYPVLLGLSGAAAGAVLAAVVSTGRRPKVTIARDVYPDRAQRGRPAFARLRVHNTSLRRQAGFTAADRIGAGVNSVTVRALPPGAEAVHHYELPTQVRGRHQVGPLTLERTDPLALGRSRLSLGNFATIWVHPRTYPVRAIAGGHPRHHHEGRATDDSLRGSLDLREVREYVVGDEVRYLHWKATARTGQLMVRVYADPNQPRFTTLLDTRRELVGGAVFEEAVDLAASLIVSAAGAEHRCRLVTSCGMDVPAAGGADPIRRVLDELCVLEPAGAAGLPLVPGLLSQSGGGSLAVVLSGMSPADRAALAALRRRFSTVVVVALGGSAATPVPADAPVPDVTVLHARDAADAVRQWNAAVAA